MGKRILFTGGSGKAGRHVVPYLLGRGHRVVIEAHLVEGNPSEALREFDRYVIDLRDQLGLAPSPAIAALVDGLLAAPA